MNAKKRERMLFIVFFLQKLGEFLDDPHEKSRQLRMGYNGIKGYFENEIGQMTEDEKLKLKTDMERKHILIDYKRHLDFAYRNTQLIVDVNELCTLAGYAVNFACQFCDRDHDEQNNCILRETLIRCNAVSGVDIGKRDGCPYIGICAKEVVAPADRRLQSAWAKAQQTKGRKQK